MGVRARLRRSSLVRFVLVGGIGELLYLGLYALALQLTGQRAAPAIAIAGTLSLLVNAVLHARLSFQVAFRLSLLLRYALIQLFCLGLSVALGALLQRLGIPALAVGILSGAAWSLTSFVLTRRSFRDGALTQAPAAVDMPPPGCV
ncbi:MAG: GtrA family protein [Cyanobium sp.]